MLRTWFIRGLNQNIHQQDIHPRKPAQKLHPRKPAQNLHPQNLHVIDLHTHVEQRFNHLNEQIAHTSSALDWQIKQLERSQNDLKKTLEENKKQELDRTIIIALLFGGWAICQTLYLNPFLIRHERLIPFTNALLYAT